MKNTIKVERAIKDMTQQDLAVAIGVSRQTINSIVYFPPESRQEAIADRTRNRVKTRRLQPRPDSPSCLYRIERVIAASSRNRP